ncbi:MAG: cupin-like domain-containing protein [Bacteroidia bacterium]|nr:cupin-like domain-containing protein [Bacteroidia bacterium]
MFFHHPDIFTLEQVSDKKLEKNSVRNKPIVIKQFAKRWKASELWDFNYLKEKIKHFKVPVYNNFKSDAYTPVNTADAYLPFDKYIDLILQQPEYKWRLFLFNIYTHAPELLKDIDYPNDLISPIVKQAPMLFIGGKGSITHMHFDIDMSTVLHVQIRGRKKFLLIGFQHQYDIYRKPFEVLAWPDFSHYSERLEELEREFPKLKDVHAYEVILEENDALIMPPGFWHHIEYIDNSIAISMRSINLSLSGVLRGVWYLTGMRWIDTIMKKYFPIYWNNFKVNHTKYFDNTLKKKYLLPHSRVQVIKPSEVN